MSGLMILPFTANALSATTAKTIKGTEPTFKAVSGENRLGFTVNGTLYSQQAGNIDASVVKAFDPSLTFNDFVIATPNFTVANDYDDSDGDGARTTGTGAFTVGALEYKWTNGLGAVIGGTGNTANLSKVIGCGSGIPMPLKLAITLKGVQVHSEYGDPRDSTLTDLTKIYQIGAEHGFCYAMPNQMITKPTQTWKGLNGSALVWNSGSSTRDPIKGGGYSADFDPKWGFKASASTKFPTTGFIGAQFKLVMTGVQGDWTYSVPVNPGGGVSVDSNGIVTLNSKPTGKVTVTAELKSDTSIKHDYEFTLSTNGWFIPKIATVVYASAITACGGEENIPTRAELTNSPQISVAPTLAVPVNAYTRAIGGGLLGEWGYADMIRYPSSQIQGGGIWTQDDSVAAGIPFIVFGQDGQVSGTQALASIICRG